MGAPVAAQEAHAPQDSATRGEVLAIVEGFHAALASGDSTRAMMYLHPHVVIYESGHAETLAEYRSGHLAADMEFARSVHAAPEAETIHLATEFALVLRETRHIGTFRGRSIDSRGTETMTLIHSGNGWQIRHIHWSSR